MDQLRLYASDLHYFAPELTLVVSAIILSLLDLFLPKTLHRNLLGWLTLVGLAISAIFVVDFISQLNPLNAEKAANTTAIQLLNQSYRIDDFANLFKLLFLAGTGLIVFMSMGSVKEKDIPHLGEYYYLYLPATLGAMIMASSGDLITLYVGIELLSITTYVMVAMRKNSLDSNEGAFKYVVIGGISSAFILYGMSFLYGLSGTTNLALIGSILMENVDTLSGMIYLSFFLLMVGFGFKVSAPPFHNWTLDVYQGAPTPVTAFLSVISKAAGLAIIFRVIYSIYYGVGSQTLPRIDTDIFTTLMVMAAAAMIVGNTLALKQRNVKRLLAYSGIANAGYMLVPIATHFSLFHYSNFSELYYYLIAYSLMTIGAFAVLMVVSEAAGHDQLNSFAGLYYRAPWTAVAMVIMVLSLSGIPVTAGFFGKLYIILGTLQLQNYWLALVMIVTSVISFYYYFGFIRQMFMRKSEVAADIKVTFPMGLAIWICAVGTVLFGLFPQWITDYVDSIFSLAKDLIIRMPQ